LDALFGPKRLVIAKGKNCLLACLTNLCKVVAQFFNQVDQDELGVGVKLFPLSVADVWVKLLAKAGQESD
jgi:hypothetical protein